MDALVVLGLGVYCAQQLTKKSSKEETVDAFETPKEFLMHEMRLHGMIAPRSQSIAGRTPFSENAPPYNVWRPNAPSHMEKPTETAYELYANALEHDRLETMDSIDKGRQNIMHKRGGAIITTYTRELRNNADPSMTTGIVNWTFMPPNPTETDRLNAAALVKAIPPNAQLSTPDGVWFTAPGLPFRYGLH